MTSAWAPWLPANTAPPAAAQRAFEARIEGWARDWFAGAPVCIVGRLARADAPRSELRKMLRYQCEGVEIALPSQGVSTLGALVLDVSTAAAARTIDDLQVLEALGSECFEDLKQQLSSLLRLDKPEWRQSPNPMDGGDYRIEIGLAARALTITIALGTNRFADFARATLPPAALRGALGDATRALARTPIAVSAALGGCDLTLADLSDLSIDDVLVLDSRLADPRPIALDGTKLSKGACTVVQAQQGIALKIVELPSK